MARPSDLRAGFADQEVEVDALVRLHHRLAVQLGPATIGMWFRRLPLRAPTREFFVGHVQMDSSFRDIELDHVAVLDKGQRSARRSLRRGVQHDGAIRGARHPRIHTRTMSVTPCFNIFAGNAKFPTSGKPG